MEILIYILAVFISLIAIAWVLDEDDKEDEENA